MKYENILAISNVRSHSVNDIRISKSSKHKGPEAKKKMKDRERIGENEIRMFECHN